MLTAISGSPFNSGGSATDIIAINGGGTFLFAGNGSSRNITTYNITNANGALVFNNIQPAHTLGVTGRLNGIGYLPNVVTVLNTNDSGPGSLRQAIADTNMNPVRGGIIKFDPLFFSVPRTIAINEQLIIAGNTSVVGPGAHLLTLRNVAPASAFSRVFVIGARVGVTLSGMTISSGNISGSGFGAGILNTSGAVLKIANCVISENVAGGAGGGLANLDGNTVILINSTVSGNISNAAAIIGGGGIHNSGFMFITNSTISGNVKNGATGGGGIWTDNTLTILDSTITNNQTTGDAGGVYAAGGGVTVRNSIIAGNRNNNLIADVAGQFAATGGGHNLIGNVGTAFGFIQQGDQTGTSAALLDPRLIKVLAYKGGTTPVHMPRGNSPAVDKGTSSSITIDERFLLRPVDIASIPNANDGADIGAVERRATESLFTPPYDFDGDGKTDIGIVRPLSAAEWWVNRSSTGVTFALQFGAMNDRIVPGDYTGDGKADIAFWRPSTGEWFILRSEDFSFFAFPFGTNGDVPAPSDYDADGKTDPTVFRTSNSTWFIAASAGGTIIQQFGVNGDVPVPADYDGDGKSDIAIFRPSNGQWWLNRSTTGTVVVTFGNNADKPVQGDYTADGKVDVAFWRPSTGEWFILRSEDFSFFAFPFGTTGDIPAPGDYDGDGKFDATVFRPSNATWFIGRSTAGTQIVQFGQTGDRPIPNAFVP